MHSIEATHSKDALHVKERWSTETGHPIMAVDLINRLRCQNFDRSSLRFRHDRPVKHRFDNKGWMNTISTSVSVIERQNSPLVTVATSLHRSMSLVGGSTKYTYSMFRWYTSIDWAMTTTTQGMCSTYCLSLWKRLFPDERIHNYFKTSLIETVSVQISQNYNISPWVTVQQAQ